MEIPDYLLVHTIVIEPFRGNSTHGPEYGAENVYPCFVDDTTTMQLSKEGEEVVSSSRVFMKLGNNVPLESRAIPVFMGYLQYQALNDEQKTEQKRISRQSLVLDVKRRDGGGLPTPDHLELMLR